MSKTTLVFPGSVHKELSSDYGISFPDLPGCVSSGRDQAELMLMAKEALELHLEGMIVRSKQFYKQ